MIGFLGDHVFAALLLCTRLGTKRPVADEQWGICTLVEALCRDFIRFDGWELHRSERRLTSPKGLVVPLSNAEFQLLSTFLKTPRRLFTRDQLMVQARGRSMDSVERSIDLLVSRLRHKLDDNPRDPTMIKTVRGEGYVFNVQTVQGQVSWAAH